MKSSANKVALLGLCTSLALILAYVEANLPPLFSSIPGIKIGLPNIVLVFVLYKFGVSSSATVSLIRIIIVALTFGSFVSFSYSLAGAVLSLTAMAILKKTDKFSVVGVSVVGSILHNLGQIIMAIILLGAAEIGYYMIILTFTGVVSGIFVGLCGAFAIKRLSKL